jgi:hypothetical protein
VQYPSDCLVGAVVGAGGFLPVSPATGGGVPGPRRGLSGDSRIERCRFPPEGPDTRPYSNTLCITRPANLNALLRGLGFAHATVRV